MKKLLLALCTLASPFFVSAQCTTTNATSCQCPTSGSTNCDLLPDITISWSGILNYKGGPNEYKQLCNPPCSGNDGRLRLTASTPNIGFGPLTVRGSTSFVCGTDTFSSNPGTCADGSTPRQLIQQRVYHKNGNTMSYYDRWAGGMTYHQSHGHNHVDDWGIFSLRIRDTTIADPRQWPIVASGGKLGFCLMDYYQCGDASAVNHCKDVNTVYNQGISMDNADFPNFGLGGGQYNCSPIEQGISSGYTDVYDEDLDLMWINLPNDLCNGEYWIVIIVDPHNSFLESDETNNYTAVPFTLTQQNPPNTAAAVNITANRPTRKICVGDSLQLTATAGTSVLWNTGATTQSIWVKNAGNYSATVTNYCGTGTSDPFKVEVMPLPSAPSASNDTLCGTGAATLSATGTGTLVWTNANGTELATGPSFTTPTISSSTNYFVHSEQTLIDTSKIGPVHYDFGTGAFQSNTNQNSLLFTTFSPITLVSVKVFSQNGGAQVIQLRDSSNAILQTKNVTVAPGESRITLNWSIPVGESWKMTAATVTSLYRNNTNSTDFPYILNEVVSITGSSAGPAYYYYYYDWEVRTENRYCASPKTAVSAIIENCTGIDQRDLNASITVYPNPAHESMTINVAIPGTSGMDVQITDLLGSVISRRSYTDLSGQHKQTVSLEELPVGAYLIDIKIGERHYVRKLIKN